MADRCFSAIKACRMRITRLDRCGRPVVGPNSVIISDGFVSVGASADIEEGEEFLQKNACGELCINEKDCSILKRYNLTINFCKVDPSAIEITTSQRLLLDPITSDVKGFALGESIQCDGGWSLELWQKIAGNNCDAEGDQEWFYWAWPWITNGTLGDFTFENGPFTFELTAFTKAVRTDTWGTDNRGPFCVLPVGAGLVAGEHVAAFVTDVQPPEPLCGAQTYAAIDCDGPEPFVPTPYNKVIISTLAQEAPLEPDGMTFFTYGGVRYMACIANQTGIIYQESNAGASPAGQVFQGTFGRRSIFGTTPTAGGEGEGMAYGIVAGAPFFMVGDQNNGEVWGYAPNTADLMGTWTRSSAALHTGIIGVHTFVAYDWDGDGDAEFVYCAENVGKVFIADYDGSGAVTDPANWTITEIAAINKARTIAQNCPADLTGHGRGDLVISARSPGASANYILAAPVAGSIHSVWPKTALTGYTYGFGAPWACLFDATGSGQRLDIASFDRDDGDPHYWLSSEGYATAHLFLATDPTIDPGDQVFQLLSVPDPSGGADLLVYTYGDVGSGFTTHLDLLYDNETSWEDRADAMTLDYGHAVESRGIPASVTGLPNRGEMLMSDSGGSHGGKRMALFSFYDDANYLTNTTPSLAQAAVKNSGAAAFTVNLGSAPTPGNLLVAVATGKFNTDYVSPPAGWEPVTPRYAVDAGEQWFMRRVQAGDPVGSLWSPFVVATGLPATNQFMVTVFEIAGANNTHPIMNHRARQLPSGTNAVIPCPTIGLDEVGVLVLTCYAFDRNVTSIDSYPAGFTPATFTDGQRRHATAWKQYNAANQVALAHLVVGETGDLGATANVVLKGTGCSLAIRGA